VAGGAGLIAVCAGGAAVRDVPGARPPGPRRRPARPGPAGPVRGRTHLGRLHGQHRRRGPGQPPTPAPRRLAAAHPRPGSADARALAAEGPSGPAPCAAGPSGSRSQAWLWRRPPPGSGVA